MILRIGLVAFRDRQRNLRRGLGDDDTGKARQQDEVKELHRDGKIIIPNPMTHP
jgi:hypothetical protein